MLTAVNILYVNLKLIIWNWFIYSLLQYYGESFNKKNKKNVFQIKFIVIFVRIKKIDMKTTKIAIADILSISKVLKKELSLVEIDKILSIYDEEEENDPTATWDLIVENCIYNVKQSNVIRQVEEFALYYNTEEKKYAVSNETEVSEWFDCYTRDELLALNDEDFMLECDSLLN